LPGRCPRLAMVRIPATAAIPTTSSRYQRVRSISPSDAPASTPATSRARPPSIAAYLECVLSTRARPRGSSTVTGLSARGNRVPPRSGWATPRGSGGARTPRAPALLRWNGRMQDSHAPGGRRPH
jgi:hypothetical protein